MQTNKRKRFEEDVSIPSKKAKIVPVPEKRFEVNFTLKYPCEKQIAHGWTLQIRKLEKSDADCVPDLFASIQDFNDFVFFGQNAIVGLVKDEYGVWRGGFVGYVYEKPSVIKLPLFATSLHFRRQGLGRLILAYLQEHASESASIIPLAMDDEVPLKFWESLGCTKMEDTSEINRILTQDEQENLIAMKLTNPGESFEKLAEKFGEKKPVYTDMMKRYASTKEEIELLKESKKQMELGKMKLLVDIPEGDLEKGDEEEEGESDFDIEAEEDEEDEEYVLEDMEAIEDGDETNAEQEL